jgi:hypothetical protein
LLALGNYYDTANFVRIEEYSVLFCAVKSGAGKSMWYKKAGGGNRDNFQIGVTPTWADPVVKGQNIAAIYMMDIAYVLVEGQKIAVIYMMDVAYIVY